MPHIFQNQHYVQERKFNIFKFCTPNLYKHYYSWRNIYFYWDPTIAPTVPTIPQTLAPTELQTITSHPTLSPIIQVYGYEGCYNGTVWENQRQSDVTADIGGVLQCRDDCENAGFSYFGLECPRSNNGVLAMHCECGSTLPTESHTEDINCRQFSDGLDPASHCIGTPDFVVHDANVGIYYLGGHSFNSAYQVTPSSNTITEHFNLSLGLTKIFSTSNHTFVLCVLNLFVTCNAHHIFKNLHYKWIFLLRTVSFKRVSLQGEMMKNYFFKVQIYFRFLLLQKRRE